MGVISQYDRVTQYPTYALARFYCFSCGFSVVPLWPRSKRRVLKGTHFQTWFPRDDHLWDWFCNNQQYGIAIVPGEVSGNLVILDFDELAVYQVWLSLVPGASDLPCVRSARGVHVYVRLKTLPIAGSYCDGQFEGVEFGQIIVRGTITAPPSVHQNGHQYAWAAGDPRRVPLFPCLAHLGVERISNNGAPSMDRKPLPEKSHRVDPPQRIRNPWCYVQAAIIGEQRVLLQAAKGSRNQCLYRSALKLAKYLDIVSETEIETELERIALQAGLNQKEIGPTIRSGLQQGIKNGVLRIKEEKPPCHITRNP